MHALHDARMSTTRSGQVLYRSQLELRQVLQHLSPVGPLGLVLVQLAAGLHLLLQGVWAEHSRHRGLKGDGGREAVEDDAHHVILRLQQVIRDGRHLCSSRTDSIWLAAATCHSCGSGVCVPVSASDNRLPGV